MHNKLSQFWQELKRRKVVRVITVYAASAFVILELLSIIIEPLKLPEWTLQFAIVFLCIGFIIAVILSWIFDIKPEGGIEKTKPVHKVKGEDRTVASNSWRIASYISFVVIVTLIVLNIIPRISAGKEFGILDKSIAVLPFKNDSPDDEKMYFINGTMEEILDNLCKIEDLRVVSRNSVEQYRDNPKPTPEIAVEMNVSYVLEGSGQREGNKIRLTVQLLDAKNDKHIWSESYYREIEDIFDLQNEIAQLVAAEIDALITPEEKQLIEKIPTNSITAYDFYQRARQEHLSYQVGYQTRAIIPYVEDLYSKALEHDSTFAEAYVGLAHVYWDKHYWDTYFSEEFLDSVHILANIALSFNDQLADAFILRGEYYREKGLSSKAIEEYKKSLLYNPNNWLAYFNIGQLYFYADHVEVIKNLQKAISLNRSNELPLLLGWLSQTYAFSGFFETAEHYAQEFLNLVPDSALYFMMQSNIQQNMGEWEQALRYSEIAYSKAADTLYLPFLTVLGMCYSVDNQYIKALKYYKLALEASKATGNINLDGMHRIGYAFWQNGLIDEGNKYLDKQVEY